MPFVLDASVTMTWAFPDELNPYAYSVLDVLSADSAVVPSVWPLEIGNVLRVGERRGRLASADVVRFLDLVAGLPIDVEAVTLGRALGVILDL